jgi:hypothetical protein
LLRSVEKMYIGSDHIRPRRFHGGKDAMMNDIVQRERQVDGPLDKNVEVDNILNAEPTCADRQETPRYAKAAAACRRRRLRGAAWTPC